MEESTVSKLLSQIREIAELAGIRTSEYARISRKRLDVLSLGREMAREKTELGERIYELSKRPEATNVLDDVNVRAIIARIRKLEESLAEVEKEIGSIREAARQQVDGVRKKYEEARSKPTGAQQSESEPPAGGSGGSPEPPESLSQPASGESAGESGRGD